MPCNATGNPVENTHKSPEEGFPDFLFSFSFFFASFTRTIPAEDLREPRAWLLQGEGGLFSMYE
jgi:hypothetical protein